MVKKCTALIFNLIFVGVLLVFSSCKSSEAPNILIIAIDQLGSAESLCHREATSQTQKSGFVLLCGESVRATHAYTTSTMSVPSLTSLLTGLYPFQHQVRFNSPPGLKSESLSAAEAAWSKGYQTAFFSGHLSHLRRTGLQQGFVLFDDTFDSDVQFGFRPIKETGHLFLEWLEEISSAKPFFTVLTASDLLFPEAVTTNQLGEIRSQSYESQLEEIDESLFKIFTALKKKNLWDKTYIIVTGLNGRPLAEVKQNYPKYMNLSSEATQITLLMKPIYGLKDVKSERTFDPPISLADVGYTLFDILKFPLAQNDKSQFPVVSLEPVLKKTAGPWTLRRLIPIESSWLSWQNLGATRWAMVAQHELYIFDRRIQVFNTLTDRLEKNPNYFNNIEDLKAVFSHQALQELGLQQWRWPEKLPRDLVSYYLSNQKKISWSDNPCLKWAIMQRSSSLKKECNNPDFQSYMAWNLTTEKSAEKEMLKELFLRRVGHRRLIQKFHEQNLYLEGVWEPISYSLTPKDELDELIAINEKLQELINDYLKKMELKKKKQSAED
jgi:hypothetical protein